MNPPFSVLKLLFSLKYVRGVSDVSILSREIGCSERAVESIDMALTEHLKRKVGVVTQERLELICPECLEAKVFYDPERKERVCGNCGCVLEQLADYDESLPYDLTYALTSDLAYDKSLGGTLNGKALMRVIAQSPASEVLAKNGNIDLGLRARMIKILTERFEPPALTSALKRAYDLSKAYDLEADKTFNHTLGKNVRKAFLICSLLGKPFTYRGVAETCFLLTLYQFGRKALAKTFQEQMSVNYQLLAMLIEIDTFIKNLRKSPPSPFALEIALANAY
jgi:hypothetical protein